MNWASLAAAIILPPLASAGWAQLLRWPRRIWLAGWASSAVVGMVIGALGHDLPWLAGSSASLVIMALVAWWTWLHRKGRRALALAGAKSRAALAALVRRARQAARPRPVLRPVPGQASTSG